MIEQDKPAFAAALAELALLKPGAKLAKETYAAWWNALKADWSLPEFQAACRELTKTCEFMPSPYHFEQLRKSVRQTPGEAWALVLANVRHGAYRNGVTVGGLVDRVVLAMGGYHLLGMTNSDQLHFRERRFAELWSQQFEADEVRAALPDLSQREQARFTSPSSSGPQPVSALLGPLGLRR
ncbi:MAG: hypothetical protein WD793_02290 [Steroidobacteraceae bacterium]